MDAAEYRKPCTAINRFTAGEKTVTVYKGTKDDRVVYFNTYGEQGGEVWDIMRGCGASLVTIADLDWNRDMSPWEAPAAVRGDEPFSGRSWEYLSLMLNKIVPKAEEILGAVSQRGIAGYSMAGMFALYALYHTDIFTEAASVSGSLWFPGFKDYVFSHEMKVKPNKLYFSLGDAESKTRNQYLRTVRENTEAIEYFYREKGIETVFKLNRGGHFSDAPKRAADGIMWICK